MERADPSWSCPVCASRDGMRRWPVGADGSEGGVDARSFRPSASAYGRTAATVVECAACGHGSLEHLPDMATVMSAYGDAVDEVSLREEPGQVRTADAALDLIEAAVPIGRLVDLGCWTGSFVVAARRRGWDGYGVEPSGWASERARARGVPVQQAGIDEADLEEGSFAAVVLCDVLEHLLDPGRALDRIHDLLQPGGVLYLTVPDAGSGLARRLGRRWWSVLPMHVQYFTRASLARLLAQHGLRAETCTTHAKAFSVQYYGERAATLLPGTLASTAERVAARLPARTRLVAPDFRDRVQVIARRTTSRQTSGRNGFAQLRGHAGRAPRDRSLHEVDRGEDREQ